VNYAVLLHKLHSSNVPCNVLGSLVSMFSRSKISVDYGGKKSFEWLTKRGLRQGGVLSAYLFSFYIDSILRDVSDMPHGCKLGINKLNIQAYADDLVVFCPTANGLQQILNRLSGLLAHHELLVNTSKTKTMVFKKSGNSCYSGAPFFFRDIQLENVVAYKYLGIFITYNLCEKDDVIRLRDTFSRSVGMFYRKFFSVDHYLKFKLLNVLCMSFYGSELWLDKLGSVRALKDFAIAYHYAFKKLIGLPKRFSNHLVCNELGVLTFEHLTNWKRIRFLFWLNSCTSPCFSSLKIYFMRFSNVKRVVDSISFRLYGISNILDNEYDAIISRIFFVQNTEPSSLFVGL